jgi:heme exporter protein D
MDLGPHAGFIIVSYVICGAVIAGLILWVRIDKARLEKTLRTLADQGVTRSNSSKKRPDAT